jgi:hypothetical protein
MFCKVYCTDVMNHINNKDPGPEGPALIIPRGDLVYRHLTIFGVLEYWSGGVMEETPFFKSTLHYSG